ncbi:hypothetical protein M0805_005707 [Coniferiporia weirii]|nr:hypothetical protein M0805_005707 [Coniferiporia weirii]
MVDGSDSDLAALRIPYHPSFIVDDGPLSSEDGSGLHSPTFMDSDTSLDGHRHDFRAPPPDLDIRSVEGLLASHFPPVEHSASAAIHGYAPHTYSHSGNHAVHYSPYPPPNTSRVFEDDRRFLSREVRGGYGGNGIMMQSTAPATFLSGRMSNSKSAEMPRPVTLPSLLPTNNPPVSNNRLLARINTERGRTQDVRPGLQHEVTSPLSPSDEPVKSPLSAKSAQTESSGGGQSARREPSLVVIACRQCRARKIRCDSTRPSCNNCVRRQNECQYDAVPKRRGPDKRPGTRQRSCKKRPADGSLPVKKKQKKSTAEAGTDEPSPTDTEGPESIGRTASGRSNSASRGSAMSSGLSTAGGALSEAAMGISLGSGADYGSAIGMGGMGTNTKANMGLRLDMNFMGRPQSFYSSGQLGSSYSHSRTHSTQSSQSFHLPSASVSPTSSMSLHTYSARSPDLTLPKPSLRREPFSMYEQLSSDGLSDSEISGRSFARQLDLNAHRPDTNIYYSPPSALSIDFNNKLWWDTLLNQYSLSQEQSEAEIMKDLSFLFNSSIHWLSFLNERHFFRRLSDRSEREKLQPSLVLSALALATLLQSSELGLGMRGRERALWLRDTAQSYLESSWNSSSVDPSLAQAAMLIAIFESSAHPQHSGERACNSLYFLDQIIRALALTAIDAGDPNASVFAPESVPIVPRPQAHDITVEERCYCVPPVHSPQLDLSRSGRLSPTWSTSISWDPNWSVEEIQREETRRLCWAALSLAAAHTAHCAAFHTEPLDLFLSRPENYALLFPGEKSASADEEGGPNYSPKQSIWALYCRSMLLWNSCLHLRKYASDTDKAEFSLNAWMEASGIQDALDAHKCSTESHLMYMTREHVFNTRIAVSYEFRRLQNTDVGTSPKFNRRQAEEWIHYQAETARRFEIILHDGHDPLSQVLARRPFYVWWFMSQLAISMSLWVYDNTLVRALDLCKAFLVPLDILSALWPCSVQRDQYLTLRKELSGHCNKAGISAPPPADFSLPVSLTQ